LPMMVGGMRSPTFGSDCRCSTPLRLAIPIAAFETGSPMAISVMSGGRVIVCSSPMVCDMAS
jgi:hypothetical protein